MRNGVHYEKSGLSPYRPDRESIPGHSQENVLDLGSAVRAALADPRSLGKKVLNSRRDGRLGLIATRRNDASTGYQFAVTRWRMTQSEANCSPVNSSTG